MIMKKKVVDPKYARRGEYKNVIDVIAKEEKCPFCPDNFRYHKNPILKRKSNWFITKSSWPYKNTSLHFLVIGAKHKEKILELTPRDFLDILFLSKWVVAEYKIKGGALAMRFGETDYTGATVCHLHMHIVVPKKRKKIIFPIG